MKTQESQYCRVTFDETAHKHLLKYLLQMWPTLQVLILKSPTVPTSLLGSPCVGFVLCSMVLGEVIGTMGTWVILPAAQGIALVSHLCSSFPPSNTKPASALFPELLKVGLCDRVLADSKCSRLDHPLLRSHQRSSALGHNELPWLNQRMVSLNWLAVKLNPIAAPRSTSPWPI